MCSKLSIKTPEQELWTYFTPFFIISIVDFEQVNVSWDTSALIVVLRLAKRFVVSSDGGRGRENIKTKYIKSRKY